MARIVTLKCDKCGKEGLQSRDPGAANYLQLWQVGILFAYSDQRDKISNREEWCRDCVAAIDLLRDKRDKHEKEIKTAEEHIQNPYVEATLEERIRAIVREEIDQ